MKTKFILLLCIITAALSSCNGFRDLQKRKYRPGYYVGFASLGNSKSLVQNSNDGNILNDTLHAETLAKHFVLNEGERMHKDLQEKVPVYSRGFFNELTAAKKGGREKINSHFYEPIAVIKIIDGDTSKTGKKKNSYKRPEPNQDEKIKGARTITITTLAVGVVFLLLAIIGQAAVGINLGIAILFFLGAGELLFGLLFLIYLLVLLHQKRKGTVPDENDPKVKLRMRKILMWLLIAAYVLILLSLIPAMYYLAGFAILLGIIALIFKKKKNIKSIVAVFAALGAIILAMVIGYNNTLPKSQ